MADSTVLGTNLSGGPDVVSHVPIMSSQGVGGYPDADPLC